MPGSYSMDLRERVMADVASGMTIEAVAQKYSISSRAIFQWKNLLDETGGLEPRQGRTGPQPKLEPYRESILSAVDNNSSVTLEELKSQLDLPGCVQTLWNSLSRWGIVLKKSHASGRTTAA